MAPELLRGDQTYTEAVAIYSMAMVLFEALTLEIPYDGFHVGQLVVLVSQKVGVPTQSAPPPMLMRCVVANRNSARSSGMRWMIKSRLHRI